MSDIFDNMDLNTINPELAPVPDGDYNFRVVEAKLDEFSYKKDRPDKGVSAGDTAKYIKFGFVIVNDPEHAGRRVYQAIFPDANQSSPSVRGLRVLMDATGIPQTAGLADWLEALVNNKAEFSASLFGRVDKRDNNIKPEVRLTTAKATV